MIARPDNDNLILIPENVSEVNQLKYMYGLMKDKSTPIISKEIEGVHRPKHVTTLIRKKELK